MVSLEMTQLGIMLIEKFTDMQFEDDATVIVVLCTKQMRPSSILEAL